MGLRKFNWAAWFLALVIMFAAFSCFSYLLGMILWPKTYDIYQACFVGSLTTMIIYWAVANRAPRYIGDLCIDTTRDDKDIYRFEFEKVDMSKFPNNEYVMIKIKRTKLRMTSEEVEMIQKGE